MTILARFVSYCVPLFPSGTLCQFDTLGVGSLPLRDFEAAPI
jgi:hypothetical protein